MDLYTSGRLKKMLTATNGKDLHLCFGEKWALDLALRFDKKTINIHAKRRPWLVTLHFFVFTWLL
jgi:hypothetical protein